MGMRASLDNSTTAAQFVRQFAEWRGRADGQPVFITSYGRITHTLLGIRQFEAMHRDSARQDSQQEQATADSLLCDLSLSLGTAMIVCDPGLRVVAVNPAAAAMAGVARDDGIGRLFSDAFPAARGTILAAHAERLAAGRMPAVAEFSSPFGRNLWVRMRSFWWRNRAIILLEDISQEVSQERFADEDASIVESFSRLPGMAHIRLSQRGTIVSARPGLAGMVGLLPDRLQGAAFADLVDLAHRVEFRAALEEVLRGGAGQCVALRLISNEGSTIPVHVSIGPLVGSYGPEGAVLAIMKAQL